MATERRRWPRQALAHGMMVTLTADGWSQPCRIADIAEGGAVVRLSGAPPRNLEVRIEHPLAGYLYATRAWVGPAAMGIAFDSREGARAFLSRCGTPLTFRQSA